MNIKTSHNLGIANQMQLNLFNDEPNSISEPIIYIGYQVSDIGEVLNPRLMYIDEGHIKWTITKDSLTNSNVAPIFVKEKLEEPLVSLKKTYKEIANNNK